MTPHMIQRNEILNAVKIITTPASIKNDQGVDIIMQ